MQKSIIWLFAIAIQIYKFFQFRRLIKLYRNLYYRAKNLQVLSVSQLYNKITKQLYEVGEYVLCQGWISGSQVCKSRLDKNLKVIYYQLVLEKIMEIGTKTSQVKKMLQKIRPSFLNMTDNKKNIKIYETSFTRMITTTTRKKITKIKQKLFQFNWLLSIFSKFPLPTKLVSLIYIQNSIPENSSNVVFGKVGKNQLGQLYFQKPFAIGPFKQSIVQCYINSFNFYTISCYFLVIAIIITFLLFYKYQLKQKIKQYMKKQNNSLILNKYKKIVVQDRICSKCHQKISNLINHPCGHLNLCNECGFHIQKCNQCKKNPKQRIQVFPC